MTAASKIDQPATLYPAPVFGGNRYGVKQDARRLLITLLLTVLIIGILITFEQRTGWLADKITITTPAAPSDAPPALQPQDIPLPPLE